MKAVTIKYSKSANTVNGDEKMITDCLQRCIFGRVHTEFGDVSPDKTNVFQNTDKLNVSNEVWYKWSLSGILASFTPSDMIKHKNKDFEWKWWLRMLWFLKRVLSDKQVWACDHACEYFINLFLKYLTCKGDKKFQNVQWIAQVSIYLLKILGDTSP